MAITLFHHPFSRAAGVLWMLEEVEADYELSFVDVRSGAQKGSELVALNPMGKLPTLVDGDTVVTESAAIGLYLADRYAPGRLAPALDAAERGTYLRWSFFAPSVIEPAIMAKAGGWDYREGQAGWGNHDAMVRAVHSALEGREYLLGDQFSMADAVFGGTLRFMLGFKMLEPSDTLTAYVARLEARPALQRAEAKNAAVRAEKDLDG
jgi:glutathione S-transferase